MTPLAHRLRVHLVESGYPRGTAELILYLRRTYKVADDERTIDGWFRGTETPRRDQLVCLLDALGVFGAARRETLAVGAS